MSDRDETQQTQNDANGIRDTAHGEGEAQRDDSSGSSNANADAGGVQAARSDEAAESTR